MRWEGRRGRVEIQPVAEDRTDIGETPKTKHPGGKVGDIPEDTCPQPRNNRGGAAGRRGRGGCGPQRSGLQGEVRATFVVSEQRGEEPLSQGPEYRHLEGREHVLCTLTPQPHLHLVSVSVPGRSALHFPRPQEKNRVALLRIKVVQGGVWPSREVKQGGSGGGHWGHGPWTGLPSGGRRMKMCDGGSAKPGWRTEGQLLLQRGTPQR